MKSEKENSKQEGNRKKGKILVQKWLVSSVTASLIQGCELERQEHPNREDLEQSQQRIHL